MNERAQALQVMKVYSVWFDGTRFFVEAESFAEVETKWRRFTQRDPEFDGTEDPEEIHEEHEAVFLER